MREVLSLYTGEIIFIAVPCIVFDIRTSVFLHDDNETLICVGASENKLVSLKL